MVKLGNVATPFTGVAVAVPPSIPEEGLLPMAMVIELVAPGTTLPLVSSTATCTEGTIEAPAFVLVGWHQESQLIRRENYVKRRAYGGCQTRCGCVQRVARSCSTESQVGEGHYALHGSTRLRFLLVFRVPGFVPIVMVTVLVAPATTFPLMSSTATCTPGVMETPTGTFEGCATKTSFVAVPTVPETVSASGVRLHRRGVPATVQLL